MTINEYDTDKYEDYAPIYRDLINQENARWNERMTWLLQSQALLFACIALGWDKDPRLVYLLACIGIVSACSIGRFLYSANDGIVRYINEWHDRAPDYDGPPLTGGIRKEGTASKPNLTHPVILMPCMFVLAWLLLIPIRMTFTEHGV